MTIGIDISSLQGPHRMRGIGYTLINFINNISPTDRKSNTFVLYSYEKDRDSALSLLKLQDMKIELRDLVNRESIDFKLPGKLRYINSALNQLAIIRDLKMGDSRLKDITGLDVYLQSDQSQFLCKSREGLKKVLIAYDMIPYVLEQDYMWSYSTARTKGLPIRAAARIQVRRFMYKYKLKINTSRAHLIISISEVTKTDFLKYLDIPERKLKVVSLGVNSVAKDPVNRPKFEKYVDTSWGYVKRTIRGELDKPYILFVGGADRRRKLQDVVTAYNHLRGQGQDIKLVLAGDSMKGPRNISTEEIQKSFLDSSYLEDIVFLGFVNDEQRDWLYENALAFVFPSVYEGFGLPVLEAFSYGCPVIAYPNAATVEISGGNTLYARNPLEIVDAVLELKSSTQTSCNARSSNLRKYAENFSWKNTSRIILKNLEEVAK